VHLLKAKGHRSLKRQPSGGLRSMGVFPGIPVSFFSEDFTPTLGRDEISSLVYGCLGE